MKPTSLLSTIVALSFTAGSAVAGEVRTANDPAPKNPPPIHVESVCDCFDPGKVQVSLYGAGIVFNEGSTDDALGGGLGFGYFFCENVGVEMDATWLATDTVLHNFSGSLVLRFPIKPACIAPYILAGGGYEVDSKNQGTIHAGAGLDIRFGHGPMCPGFFADARYTWTEEDTDFTLIRAGFRFNL